MVVACGPVERSTSPNPEERSDEDSSRGRQRTLGSKRRSRHRAGATKRPPVKVTAGTYSGVTVAFGSPSGHDSPPPSSPGQRFARPRSRASGDVGEGRSSGGNDDLRSRSMWMAMSPGQAGGLGSRELKCRSLDRRPPHTPSHRDARQILAARADRVKRSGDQP